MTSEELALSEANGAQNDNEEPALSEANGAQNDNEESALSRAKGAECHVPLEGASVDSPRAFRGLEFPFAFGNNPAAFLEDGFERLLVLFRRHHRGQILFKFFLRHRLAVDVEKLSGVVADLAVELQVGHMDFRLLV